MVMHLTSPSTNWGLPSLPPLLAYTNGESFRASQPVQEFVYFRAWYQKGEKDKVLDMAPDIMVMHVQVQN